MLLKEKKRLGEEGKGKRRSILELDLKGVGIVFSSRDFELERLMSHSSL